MEALVVALAVGGAAVLAVIVRDARAKRRRRTRDLAGMSRLTELSRSLAALEPVPGGSADDERVDELAANAAGAAGARIVPVDEPLPPPAPGLLVVELLAGARLLGHLAFRFDGPVRAGAVQDAYMEAVAAQVAHTLVRFEAQEAGRATLADDALLADAAARLSSSLDPDAVADGLAAVAVPKVADHCEVALGPEPAHVTGDAAPRPPDSPHTYRVTLRSRDRTLAVATFWRDRRPLDRVERALAEQLASIASTALANAHLYDDQASSSTTLQRSLLPKTLLPVPRLHLAARYVAAAPSHEVGGDFYDVVRLDDRAIVLAIGDVQGKGVEAAALTSVARHTLRAGAMDAASPRDMLLDVNRALLYDQAEARAADTKADVRFVTAAVVALTAKGDGFHAVAASAGHPPPLVVRADGTVDVLATRGLLLGMDPSPVIEEVEADLALADTVVLYTDGVTDQRGTPFDEHELGRLLSNRLGVADADATAQLVLDTVLLMAPGQARDDLAVLVATVTRAATT
jgi:serine phosphatase RsbU (regulator of sigma subunit)